MDFPSYVSLTLTNACNLRCRMCAQWSETGFMRSPRQSTRPLLQLSDWKRVVDEVSDHGLGSILIRGGEPFLYPDIAELLRHIAARKLFIAIDSNGTRLAAFADELARLERVHVTISVDGPPAIHDAVRGVDGCFRQITDGLEALRAAEARRGNTISKSITFTISPWSYLGLSAMPDVARALGISTVCIVPNFYVNEVLGEHHERELREAFGCDARSWYGAHQNGPRVDVEQLIAQVRAYRNSLGAIHDYPYLPLSEEQYRHWFTDPETPVSPTDCVSVERVIDILPNGDANFCVDYPDYRFGNVAQNTISELWNSDQARCFRERRRLKPFAACHRCVARYMAVDRAS